MKGVVKRLRRLQVYYIKPHGHEEFNRTCSNYNGGFSARFCQSTGATNTCKKNAG